MANSINLQKQSGSESARTRGVNTNFPKCYWYDVKVCEVLFTGTNVGTVPAAMF